MTNRKTIREKMEASDIEITLQVAEEKYPQAKPRLISDSGPQFIAKDFKERKRRAIIKVTVHGM